VKKVSDWFKLIICPECGTTLKIIKEDIKTKVAPLCQCRLVGSFLCRKNMAFSVSCLSCKHTLTLEVDELPKLVLSWVEARFGINHTPTNSLPISQDI